MWETSVPSLGWDDPLEEGMASHSSILAWRIPMDRGAWWAAVHGVAESDTAEWQSTAQNDILVRRGKKRLFSKWYWASLVAQLVKNPPAMWETWVGKIPWRRERLPTPGFWPGEFHGLYSPWGQEESETSEQLSLSLAHLGKVNFVLHIMTLYKNKLWVDWKLKLKVVFKWG